MSPREAILALNLLPSFGPVRITRLLEHFGDAASVLSASENKLLLVDGIGPETAKIISRWQDHADPAKEISEAEARGISIITREDPSYPQHLRMNRKPGRGRTRRRSSSLKRAAVTAEEGRPEDHSAAPANVG